MDSKAAARLKLVELWRAACEAAPTIPRAIHARALARSSATKCSVRSLQLWASKLDALGPEGLIDGYIPAPRKVLSLTGDLASDAVKVCAWWSFRIGNNPSIDTKMLYSAAGLIGPIGPIGPIPVADILATIDCYYAWPCDRSRMPFKPFARWIRYDFQKWLLRAAADNDYRRTIAEQRGATTAVDPLPGVTHPVPLLDPPLRTSVPSCLRAYPLSKTRRRDVLDRSTRQSLRALSGSSLSSVSSVPSVVPSPSGVSVSAFPSIASALVSLDDSFRIMLLRAAQGDTDARRHAVSTFPLWWSKMPDDVRLPIERITEIPPSARRPGDDQRVTAARVRMFLGLFKRRRAGFQTLRVAAGLI